VHVIRDGARHKRAVYRCQCGTEFVAETANVAKGHTSSCGCLRRATTAERSTTHGHKSHGERSITYVAWVNMKGRCSNPFRPDYKNYGGRGITYDPSWERFETFLADMGEKPSRMTLERVDNAKGYSKDNCKWASRSMQNINRRNNVFYTLNGVSKTLSEWSRQNGIGRVTMLKRIQSGVPLEVALTQKGFCGWARNQK
jgi:hypothetical protein